MSSDGWVTRSEVEGSSPSQLDKDSEIEYRLRGDPAVYREFAGLLFWGDGEGRIVAWRRVATAPVNVGDVNGTTLGSAARFNASKPDLSLIPASILGDYADHVRTLAAPRAEVYWPMVLSWLGAFQMRDDGAHALRNALHVMDNDGGLWADCARVFDYGRKKYAQRGDCTCPAGNAARRSMSKAETTFAAATTKKTSEPGTQSSPLDNVKTADGGTSEMPVPSKRSNSADMRSENWTRPTKSASDTPESKSFTALSDPTTTGWPGLDARSVLPKTAFMSTTTITAEECEGCFAIPATSALDFSKGLEAGLRLHAPTCGVQAIVGRSGEWNWARGQAWSIPIASALRHVVFGTLRGEALDPESGLPHRGHIACNIVMLLWFLDHYPEGDDRFTPPTLRRA